LGITQSALSGHGDVLGVNDDVFSASSVGVNDDIFGICYPNCLSKTQNIIRKTQNTANKICNTSLMNTKKRLQYPKTPRTTPKHQRQAEI